MSLLRSVSNEQPDIVVQTDASGSWGCGAFCQTQWFQCDNKGVVAAIKKGLSRQPFVMHLFRCLCFFYSAF